MSKYKAFEDIFVCPICGKEFYYNNWWAYKRKNGKKTVFFCSYKCMRKFDDKKKKVML